MKADSRGLAGPWRTPLTLLAGVLVVYLAFPFAAFGLRLALSGRRGFHVPGLLPALWVSVSCATISLTVIALLGIPLAYVLARSRGPWVTVVGVAVQLPLALPPLMSGVLLVYVVGPYTCLGTVFGRGLTNSPTGIVLAMTFVSAPFLIVAARAAFASLDPGMFDVAATLGHSEVRQFTHVALPLAHRGIRAGLLLAWLRAFGEYGAVVVLAYNPASLPVYTYTQLGTGLSRTLAPTALAIAAAVMAVGLSRVRRRRPRAPQPLTSETTASDMARTPSTFTFGVDVRVGKFRVRCATPENVAHLAIVGASGSGKSALLRALAGLYVAGDARIVVDGLRRDTLKVGVRRLGYVAQGFALFAHLTVWQQLRFGRFATSASAAHWRDELGLAELVDRYPHELSGGQRQRVALGQALANSPDVLLLDEPFSAVDVPVRRELQQLLRHVQRSTGLASVVVTHDPGEAALLGDTVMVLREGRSVQWGSLRDLLRQPASLAVARTLGVVNVFEGVLADAGGLIVSNYVTLPVAHDNSRSGEQVLWSVDPRNILVRTGAPAVGDVVGVVVDVVDHGDRYEISIVVAPDVVLRANSAVPFDLGVGDDCVVSWPTSALNVWSLGGAFVEGE